MYSYAMHDVVTSKFASAAWAIRRYPHWSALIEDARASYVRSLTSDEQERLASGAADFLAFAQSEIDQSRSLAA